MASACYYVTVGAQTFAWTQFLPTIVTFSLTIASLRLHGREWFPAAFGFYLHAWTIPLWSLQTGLQMLRPHPYCAQYHTYAFPSQEAFYAAALATCIFMYSWMWNAPLGWIAWMVIYSLFTFPSLLLVWWDYNYWWEVGFSMGLGAAASALYVATVYYILRPRLPYILAQAPWTWFYYEDTYCGCEGDQERVTAIKHAVEKFDQMYGGWSLLY